jgi:hypothetical protein
MCLQILQKDLGIEKFDIRRVPHTLYPSQKAQRVSVSQELLEGLLWDEQYSFEHIITRDKSWFFLNYPSDALSAQLRDEFPEKTKQAIDTEKPLSSRG